MSIRLLCACALLAMMPATASAQHHHHRHHHHHGSFYGYANWRYVVPHSHNFRGAYYMQGNSYYYTPAPVVYNATPQAGYVAPPVQQPMQLQFGSFARCDDLTGRLESQMNTLCLDLFYNYQHNPDFDETYREAYDLLLMARDVHAMDHQGQRRAIRDAIVAMDQRYHHVQQDIASWSRANNRHLPPGDAIQKAAFGEALLHHLCFIAGVEPHQPAGGPGGGPSPETAPPPPLRPGFGPQPR